MLRTMPRNSGTTIRPPGTRLTVFRIFMGAYSTYLRKVERSDITWASLENRIVNPHEWLRVRQMGGCLLDRAVLEARRAGADGSG